MKLVGCFKLIISNLEGPRIVDVRVCFVALSGSNIWIVEKRVALKTDLKILHVYNCWNC